MKRLMALLLVFVLLLGGCVTANTVHDPVETEAGGQTVVVQYDDGSINAGTVTAENGDVYRFEASFGSDSTSVEVIYPDDGVRRASRSDGGYSSDYNFLTDSKYIDTMDLLDAVKEAKPRTLTDLNWTMILISIAAVILGIVCISSPEAIWSASRGWRFKNAEPSTASLVLYRVLGGALIVAGGLTLFVSLF